MKIEKEFPDYTLLLEKVSRGDDFAFTQLYDIFANDLIRHIMSKIQDEEKAEDILHDLFLSLWKNRQNLINIQSLPSYLYSSCRYLILNNLRKELLKGKSISITDIDVINEEVSIEDRIHYRYVIDIVENEIENLPQKCREVFKLSRQNYLSNKEISNQLNISESTVEKHINKAIRLLRSSTKRFLLFF
ncbi:RNA polymerase sigma factor [Sphingobacterium bovistauri]|uniref:RNA polymerase sigma-70 factor n=1 Tax=Sphingobacterium bovistauri TaxID=2781959 RepID=A0ABS7Z9K9_9SPHI|nr:RNA polymerase sigma-70 factor [Sphingobacterium bovistauri]MCA5005634.1 RNA polymerase sigma-70 factor [Sphingobacterium bovistauri]